MEPVPHNQPEHQQPSFVRLSDDSSPSTTVISEEQFLRRLFEQDARKGCEVLFRRYYANLCNHAIRFVYAKDIAEEIVAEVFANFWQGRVFEQINTSYQAYLYKAVRYRAYNYIRFELNRNMPFDAAENKPEVPVLKPDEVLHYHELCRKVDTIVQHLPPQCRRAFQLNRLEGKKYAEVAQELNITVSAVERLISRALAKLRTDLREDWLLGLLLLTHLLA
ncbi:RNA polymerase sigma-70 factor [Spirosoma areae]